MLTEQQTELIVSINEAAEPIILTNEATFQDFIIDSNEAASQTFIPLYNIFEESIISKEVSQEEYLDVLFRSVIADKLVILFENSKKSNHPLPVLQCLEELNMVYLQNNGEINELNLEI